MRSLASGRVTTGVLESLPADDTEDVDDVSVASKSDMQHDISKRAAARSALVGTASTGVARRHVLDGRRETAHHHTSSRPIATQLNAAQHITTAHRQAELQAAERQKQLSLHLPLGPLLHLFISP